MNSSDVRFYFHNHFLKINEKNNINYNLPGVQKRPLLCHS